MSQHVGYDGCSRKHMGRHNLKVMQTQVWVNVIVELDAAHQHAEELIAQPYDTKLLHAVIQDGLFSNDFAIDFNFIQAEDCLRFVTVVTDGRMENCADVRMDVLNA